MDYRIPPIPQAPDDLVPMRDMGIIIDRKQGFDLLAVRWMVRPDLGFPSSGFLVDVEVSPADWVASQHTLPDGADWPSMAASIEARRPPSNHYFLAEDVDKLSFLFPLVKAADPSGDWTDTHLASGSVPQHLADVIEFFGGGHVAESELRFRAKVLGVDISTYPLDFSGSDDALTIDILKYYRRLATVFLFNLANRYEYAIALGLATEHAYPYPDSSAPNARVQASWNGWNGNNVGGLVSCDSSPSWATFQDLWQQKGGQIPAYEDFDQGEAFAQAVPGKVLHPAFSPAASWRLSDAAIDPVTQARLNDSARRFPGSPTVIAGLLWTAPTSEGILLDYKPILFRVERDGAGDIAPGTLFSLAPGAAMDVGTDPQINLGNAHALDALDHPWPRMWGSYAYMITGINALGNEGHYGVAGLDINSQVPPHAVQLSSSQTSLEVGTSATQLSVGVTIPWSIQDELTSPALEDFHFRATWAERRFAFVDITAVEPHSVTHRTVRVAALGPNSEACVGSTLSTPTGDFLISGAIAGPQPALVVALAAGRAPQAGERGRIDYFDPHGAPVALPAFQRAQTAYATFQIDSVLDAGAMQFQASLMTADEPIDGSPPWCYVAAVGAFMPCTIDSFGGGSAIFTLLQPEDPQSPAGQLFAWLQQQPDLAGVMTGSPVSCFWPSDTQVTLNVPFPTTQHRGVLRIEAWGVDSTGGVGPAAQKDFVVRRAEMLPSAGVAPFDPAARLWAKTASVFDEQATYELAWSAVAGAAAYEVWRVVEGRLGADAQSVGDAVLRSRADVAPAELELRSNRVFGTSFADTIPGRAPTRVLYKVRAIDADGEPGSWSPVIGPVHVPDMRRPAPVNLLSVTVPSPSASYDDAARRVVLEWTLAGDRDRVRFDIEASMEGQTWTALASVPPGTSPNDPDTLRYRYTLQDVAPGLRRMYRVVAIREALDPIDPAGVATRDIRGVPSQGLWGAAIGNIIGPTALAAAWNAIEQRVEITWSNPETYQAIELRRKSESSFGYARLQQVPGGQQSASDTPGPGVWTYQLRAFGFGRESLSDAVVQVTVP